MIFGLGVPELLIILLVIVLVFGPAALSKTGKAAGKAVNAFKKEVEDPKEDKETSEKEKE